MGGPIHVHPDRGADPRSHRAIPGLRDAGSGDGGAELCMVTSLHDGMNLVAKEFVSARDDERGVLILSQFTGAARELPEALIVNPYDTDQCTAALQTALVMPAGEQRARIRLMRGLIQEFNVYRWAVRMLIDAAGMRRRGRLLDRGTTPERLSRRPADRKASRVQ